MALCFTSSDFKEKQYTDFKKSKFLMADQQSGFKNNILNTL